MKWHGLYQSVSHSVAAVVPEYRLPLRPAPLGNSHSFPPLLSFRVPLRSFTSFYLNFYKLSLFSLLFPHLQLWLSEKGGRSMLRGVEFVIVLGIRGRAVTRHLALSLHAPRQPSFLKLPSSTALVFPANRFTRLHVSDRVRLSSPGVARRNSGSGSGRASLRAPTGSRVCLTPVRARHAHVLRRKMRFGSERL